MQEYYKVIFYMIISGIVAVAIVLLPFIVQKILGTQQYNGQKLSPYECGFEPVGTAPRNFNVKFYLIAILFVIFDLEIALLFPWALNVANDGRDFEITLEVFQYETLEKKWYQMPKTKIQLFFTSQVKNENGDVIYNGKHEYLVENTYPIFQPRAKKNEKILNDALSQGIKRIFMDQNLIEAIKGF